MWVLIASHRWQQHIERVGIIMSHPVDEEGRGAAYSAMPPAFDILTHPRRKNMVLQLPAEAFGIKSELGSIVQQVLIVERILVLEQHLVHLPELALGCGSFRCFCSMPGMRMQLRHGKMAKDKAQVRTQLPLDFFHDRIGEAAVGTFVVTEAVSDPCVWSRSTASTVRCGVSAALGYSGPAS